MSRAAGTKYRSARLRLNLRYGYDRDLSRLPSGIFCSHWRLALDRWFFIRNRRYSLGGSFVFINEEYLIALVDFIYSSRGRLERDRGFANPLSLSNTSPDPWGNPLRRGILAAAVYANIGFLYPVQTVCPHFDVTFGGIVFGLVSLAFQKITLGICLSFFIIGRMDCSCLRLRGVLLWSIVGFALTATFQQFCWVQAHFTNRAGCKNIVKNAFVRLKL